MDACRVHIAGSGCDGVVLGLVILLTDVDMVWANHMLDVFGAAEWSGDGV